MAARTSTGEQRVQQLEQRIPAGAERRVDCLAKRGEGCQWICSDGHGQAHGGMVPHRSRCAPPYTPAPPAGVKS